MQFFNHKSAAGAFSLVEVVLALGVVSFGIIAIVGLLPGGLNAVRTSRESAAATQCMEQISESIRGACVTDGTYRALGIYSDLKWQLGGAALTYSKNNLAQWGGPTSTSLEQRQACVVLLQPPANIHSAGTALISVAWPSSAVWNPATQTWKNAQGTLSTWTVFLPAP